VGPGTGIEVGSTPVVISEQEVRNDDGGLWLSTEYSIDSVRCGISKSPSVGGINAASGLNASRT